MSKRLTFFLIILQILSILSPFSFAWGQNQPTGAPEAPIFKEIFAQYGSARGAAELSSKDPRDIVAKVIKIFLSLLGTIFLVLMIYGGYLWMTAQGEEDQMTKAKDLIRNAIIGLIIVLAAYTITKFVIEKGVSSTNVLLR